MDEEKQSAKDWNVALSLGEKQRMCDFLLKNPDFLLKNPDFLLKNVDFIIIKNRAIARLLFHKPRFAVLDECTSTLSEQMAVCVYAACETAGITVVSVSHRSRHKRFHSEILTLEGDGRWNLAAVGDIDKLPPSPPGACYSIVSCCFDAKNDVICK